MERGKESDPSVLPLKDSLPEPLLQDLLLVGLFSHRRPFCTPQDSPGAGHSRWAHCPGPGSPRVLADSRTFLLPYLLGVGEAADQAAQVRPSPPGQ